MKVKELIEVLLKLNQDCEIKTQCTEPVCCFDCNDIEDIGKVPNKNTYIINSYDIDALEEVIKC